MYQPKGSLRSSEYFRNLTLLHYGLMVGGLLVSLVFYYVSGGGSDDSPEHLSYLTTVGIIIAFAGVFFSAYLYKSKTLTLREEKDLEKKLRQYYSTSIKSWAILQFAILSNLVFFFLVLNDLLFFISLFLIGLLFLKRPSRNRCEDSLSLNKEEIRIINDPDIIVIKD